MNTGIKIAVFIDRLLPLALKRAAARGFSCLAYGLLHKHKLIAVHNLSRSFPEKSLKEILQIIKDSYASFAQLFVEFPQLLYLNRDNISDWVTVKGLEHYEKACRSGKGVLLFSAHFGNWEMGNAALALLSTPPTFMARKLDSPFLESFTTYARNRLGIGKLDKEHAMRSVLGLLRKGEPLLLLIDQNVAAREGVFITFFGRPACATAGIALMALHTGAAVLPIFTTRLPDGRYLTEIGAQVPTVDTGDREADVLQNTQNYNAIIEDHVRRHPGQWLWLHQRWKTKRCQLRRRRT